MCGILGKITFAGEHEPPELFDRAVKLLEHRGPDDRGTHHATFKDQARISLGQTRLSILDLSSAGHQPMFSPRSGACVVYNGEVYNYREIRGRLEAEGYEFTSECDTEVVLAAYDRWQDAFVDELNGMFAIAIWDRQRHRMVLARDRVGIKPLYYYWDGRQLAFASEVSALVALPTLKLEVCQEAIRTYLWHGFIASPLSIYGHVRKLVPGHLLTCDLADPRPVERRYWDAADYYTDPQHFGSEEEVLEALHAELTEAVRRRLVSDVPLGAFLSGGIDSSLVVALMRQAHGDTVRTFTVGFSVPKWNEAPAAKRIAEHLGTQHEEFYLSEENILDAARTIGEHYDEPFADESSIPTLALSRMTRNHVTVALSGDGGDELFCGYPRYNSRYLRLFRPVSAIPRWLRQCMAAGLARWPRDRVRSWGAVLGFKDFAAYFLHPRIGKTWLYPGLHRDCGNDDRLMELGREVAAKLAGCDHVAQAGAMDVHAYMVDDILTKVDRASMAVSLEVRVPILDHNVLQLAARIPSSFKTAGGELKHLLKVLLSRDVPRPLWERPKRGFGVPLVHWLRGPLREWAHDQLNSRESRLHDWLDYRQLQAMLEDHMSGRRNVARIMWSCLQLACWDRRVTSLRRDCLAATGASR